jgi:hypothetical protein
MSKLLDNKKIIAEHVEMNYYDSTTSSALLYEMKMLRCKTYKSISYCLAYSAKRCSTLKS